MSAHFAQKRTALLDELESLTVNIGHIKEIVSTQQDHARVSGLNEQVFLEDLIETAFRMIHPGFERHEIEVRREFAVLPAILADRHKILQTLLNLLNNAKRAISESAGAERILFVRTRLSSAGMVAVDIRDTGVGIPAENLTRIFAQGFTTRNDGHGFGLHSGVLAVQQMGGSLRAESDGPGLGATFTLELPLRVAKSEIVVADDRKAA